MTIINPHPNYNLRKFLLILFLFILAGGMLYVFEYNALVNTRFELNHLKKKNIELIEKNADLKSEFYQAIDLARFKKIAETKGLVLERYPEYLNQNQWLSDSSH